MFSPLLSFSLCLEYRVWVLEVRVEQQYIGQISILNRNFSTALSSHTSRVFREEARTVEAMVRTYFHFHSRIKLVPGNLHYWFQFWPFSLELIKRILHTSKMIDLQEQGWWPLNLTSVAKNNCSSLVLDLIRQFLILFVFDQLVCKYI